MRGLTRLFAASVAVAALTIAVDGHAQCASDADCKGNRSCVEGACVEASTACSKDTDCPGEAVCEQGTCAAAPAASTAPPASPEPAPTGAPAPTGGTPPPPPAAAAAPPPPPPSYGAPPPSAQPTGYDTETEGIAALWIPGIITMGTSYLISVVSSVAFTVTSGDSEPALGVIPLVGPFVVVGTYGDQIDGGVIAVPIIFGALQNVGLIMIVLGVAIRHDVEVPRAATLGDGETATFELGPMAFEGGVGLGLTMRATE